jgi:hypothetical protein
VEVVTTTADWTFSFVAPTGFFVVDLERDVEGDREVTGQAVDRHIADLGKPELAGQREAFIDEVIGFARDGERQGAAAVMTWLDTAEGDPLAATVVAYQVEGGEALGELAEDLRRPRPNDAGLRRAEVVSLPAGGAVRVHFLGEKPLEEGRSLVLEFVQYWLPVSGTGTRMVLSCSTPLIAVAEHITPLFDDIARTIEVLRDS